MWWLAFTAVDLYIGLVVLKTMELSVAPGKRARLKIAEKIIVVLLAFCVVAFLAKILHRPH